jgi:DNA-binding response OmpR family regulator
VSERAAPFLLDALHKRIPLAGERLVLGRAPDCAVVVAEPRVSRHHAELRRQGDGHLLADLGSTNGTFLNGQRLIQALSLRDGDVIEVGSARFVYHDPEATLDTGAFPHLVFDEVCGQVWLDRQEVSLSPRQYALLRLLWSRRGMLCSRAEIARAVWPECPEHVYGYQIESLIRRLRHKLEPDPGRPTVILAVRGRGYRISPLAFQ